MNSGVSKAKAKKTDFVEVELKTILPPLAVFNNYHK